MLSVGAVHLSVTKDSLSMPINTDQTHFEPVSRGVPTERCRMIICNKTVDKTVERNKQKPSHNGNTYPLRFKDFVDDDKRLK